MKKQFCSHCGERLGSCFIGRYNEFTGEKIFEDKCTNEKCMMGCLNTGGHIRKALRDRCTRCGALLWRENLKYL